MAEFATPMAPPRSAGPDGPSIDDLLKTGTFHQRLAAARAEREKALAARGDAADPQFLPGPKPWERPEYLRGELRKPKREAQPKPAPVKPAMAAPAEATASAPVARPPEPARAKPALPAAASIVVETAPALAPAAAETLIRPAMIASAEAGTWRLRAYQLAGGVAFGVALGVGVGYWFASPQQPKATAPVSIAAAGPVAAAPGDSSHDAAQIALPAPDAIPASPDAPLLSNAALVSASLPAITGGGPVGPQMATAPAEVTASLAVPEVSAPASPLAATAPAPDRSAAPGLAAGAPDAGFVGPATPLPVTVSMPRAAMPGQPEAGTLSIPAQPETQPVLAAFSMPEVSAPDAHPGDMPLATQDTPLPVAKPAPTESFALIVHAPANMTEAEIAAAAETFEEAGFGTVTPKPAPFNIHETNVRYFSDEDRDAAARLAGILGAELRDFTGFAPKPPEGTVEVWLAGRATATAPKVSAKPAKSAKSIKPASSKKKRTAAAAGPSQVQILKDRLVRQLRAGALN